MLLLWFIIFICALFILIKGADFFTEAAEKVGLHFGLSHFVVGVTIVAFGTSLPELASSIVAVLSNTSEIVVGNVLGSNIANILLVLGLTGVISRGFIIKRHHLKKDLAILSLSAIILAVFLMDGQFSVIEAGLSLLFLVIYVMFNLNEKVKEKKHKMALDKWVFPTLLLSGVAIYFGAKYTVDALIHLATALNIPAVVLSASAVALGTSLPEVVVSVTAAKKGNAEMAVGNILGSNVFNTFAVMGIPALIGSLVIPASMLTLALPVMLFATLMFVYICYDKKVTVWESIVLLIIYSIFIFALF